MGVLAAGPGWCTGGRFSLNNTIYMVLGPVPAGRVLDRLGCSVSSRGASLLAFACGLTNSGEESLVNFHRSRQLIQRTAAVLQGRPAFGWQFDADAVFDFQIPIGVRVPTGGTYVLCAASSSHATKPCWWNLSLFPRFVWRNDGGNGGEIEAS